MLDLTRLHLSIKPELDEAISRVIGKSSFVLGEEVLQFEKEFAEFFGIKHAIGVGNGTDAITLSLAASGIGQGDEVITTSLSAFPTAEAILRTGAKPVYVDVDIFDLNIDAEKIKSAITEKTKAIVPVHLYGVPANMEKILEIANSHNLIIIEDCAQAHGAKYHSRYAGTFGLAGCFSFFPSKNLGAMGDGGMVITNNDDLAQMIRSLRAHGEEGGRFCHKYIGFNSRLDGIQAAILRVKLKYLERHNFERQRIAEFYSNELADKADYFLPDPWLRLGREHVYHLFVLRTVKRDELKKFLAEKGIQTNIHYPLPLYCQEAYKIQQNLPVVEEVVKNILSIPLFPGMKEKEMQYVADCLKEWMPSPV